MAVATMKTSNKVSDNAAKPHTERLTLRVADIVRALGVSKRALERERAAGRFPKPDLKIGRMPLWRVETINQWLAGKAN